VTTSGCHLPVLLERAVALLAPAPGKVVVDLTFGGGGYSQALLEHGAARVVGIDRDPEAVLRGAGLADRDARFRMVHGCFGDLARHLDAVGLDRVDGIVLDLGVSSFQLDQPRRGFSFRDDGPLDMRMDPGTGPSAAEVVNESDERTLADLLFRYGEERLARRIARAIVARRRERRLTRTHELAELVASVIGPGDRRIHPATRTFQALRIQVNDELGELMRALDAAERRLAPGGRLVVVAFHSLEDRIVKRFLQQRAGAPGPSRHRPASTPPAPTFRLLTRQPTRPEADEAAANPRARSARLRAAERTAA
jgi:16S rRNA (cytosine1402-N4)-methyltransferase